MTEEEWQRLYEGFETADVLTAVDQLDGVRSIVGDGENWEPPEIRTDLLKLHQLAMDVVNHGVTDKAQEMFELADDIDSQVFDMIQALETIQRTLTTLTRLYPDSLADAL
jgi:hypothetical protein